MKYDCLIVDDEQVLAETTCEYLKMFDVHSAYVTSGADCLKFLKNMNQTIYCCNKLIEKLLNINWKKEG